MGRLTASAFRVSAVMRNTFRETVRQRILMSLVPYSIVIGAGALLLREISIGQEVKILKDVGLSAMDLFGTFAAIVMGVDLVTREIERRSAYPILARPLTRSEFVLGKFLGLVASLGLCLVLMTAILGLVLFFMGDGLSLRFLVAPYGVFLMLALTVAIALFFSVITNSTLASAFTVILVIAARFSDVLRNMADVLPDVPRWLPRALVVVLPNFQNFDFKVRAVYGDPLPPGAVGVVTVYASVYAAFLLLLACMAFDRKEMV
jgi:ABC-type transport system involved in multi-copper enzyme maturation permease subunit